MSDSAPKTGDRFITQGFADWLNGFPNYKVSRSNRAFLLRLYKFQTREKRTFCFVDFEAAYTPGGFRQKIHQCRQFIQTAHKGRPTFYKLRRTKLPHLPKPITKEDMGVGPNLLENYLKNLPATP